MTCSVVFIVNIKKIKSLGGMLEETTDGGIEIKNNEAYGIVNRGGEGRRGEGRGDTASEIKMFNEREYEEITI